MTQDILLLKLAPAIASVVANVVLLIFFFRHFGSLDGFFQAARGVDGNFAVITLILLVAVVAGAVLSSISIVLLTAHKRSDGRLK